MTIASKTRLLGFQYIRAGAPFVEVSTRANFDATEATRLGAPFYGVGNEETITYPSLPAYVRLGAPFNEVTTRPDINASYGAGFTRQGAPFVVKFAGTSSFPTSTFPVRLGAPFRDVTAKASIDASEFDYTRLGAPFWVRYQGVPPVAFDATRFFIIF